MPYAIFIDPKREKYGDYDISFIDDMNFHAERGDELTIEGTCMKLASGKPFGVSGKINWFHNNEEFNVLSDRKPIRALLDDSLFE
jgi:hypothetical protein